MYCVCDTDNYKHHYHEEYFCDKDNPWRRELTPELIYMGTSCKDCGRPKIPAVKPQVDLPPYKVVWPENFPELLKARRIKFVNSVGAIIHEYGITVIRSRVVDYAYQWQPYRGTNVVLSN